MKDLNDLYRAKEDLLNELIEICNEINYVKSQENMLLNDLTDEEVYESFERLNKNV